MSNGSCIHLSAITTIKPPISHECAECVKIGAQWVHLRTCQECGRTLCCDSSPNQHASKHNVRPHSWHVLKCTHCAPIFTHSAHSRLIGGLIVVMAERWMQLPLDIRHIVF